MNSTLRTLLLWMVIFVVVILLWNTFQAGRTAHRDLNFNAFTEQVAAGHVKKVTIREQTVAAAAGVDVPVWYDVPELNGSVIATQDNHGGLWTGRISAQEFSDLQQAAVVPSGS